MESRQVTIKDICAVIEHPNHWMWGTELLMEALKKLSLRNYIYLYKKYKNRIGIQELWRFWLRYDFESAFITIYGMLNKSQYRIAPKKFMGVVEYTPSMRPFDVQKKILQRNELSNYLKDTLLKVILQHCYYDRIITMIDMDSQKKIISLFNKFMSKHIMESMITECIKYMNDFAFHTLGIKFSPLEILDFVSFYNKMTQLEISDLDKSKLEVYLDYFMRVRTPSELTKFYKHQME